MVVEVITLQIWNKYKSCSIWINGCIAVYNVFSFQTLWLNFTTLEKFFSCFDQKMIIKHAFITFSFSQLCSKGSFINDIIHIRVVLNPHHRVIWYHLLVYLVQMLPHLDNTKHWYYNSCTFVLVLSCLKGGMWKCIIKSIEGVRKIKHSFMKNFKIIN